MNFTKSWSIRARLTLAGGGVAGLLSLASALGVLMAIRSLATEYLVAGLVAVADRVASIVSTRPAQSLALRPPARQLQVVDQGGRVIEATGPPGQRTIASLHPAASSRGPIATTVCHHTPSILGCHLVVAVPAFRGGHTLTVYAAAPVIPLYVRPSVAALVFGGALMLTCALTFLCYRLLGRTLRPVYGICTKLGDIQATDLTGRVPVPPNRDEIHMLALTVNSTLERLEKALEEQRRFTADASHELRTPLAAMRAQVEDALLASTEDEALELGRSLLPSVDRLEAITTDLLTLSRLDAAAHSGRCRVDLAALVSEELARRHTTRKIDASLQTGVYVLGNGLQLARLLTNLLDNAERHAARTICLTLRTAPGSANDARKAGLAVLEVVDDGPGIPPDKREVVFQRFARLDTARSRAAGGTGLGLPIARRIAESHAGTLTVEDSGRGARLVLRLPRCPGEP
ncbi:HAMP domain-containing histidine kinase [Microbispora sp. RL4-1S]|uniref:histidine kinase n=1 Tax=Microbispora oryzae TaxID=2806554 RepID=A0A940WMV4_9ACTN|nr:HAMP domain-containing sensor histidine kinase [Microbispora oryzae]MBP2707813.1 HAMP domain-containing histidine kinase [Microbispora oryzae]